MSADIKRPWHRELNQYHWFVLAVAALGWLFDTMDQQLFNLARVPAMRELLTTSQGLPPDNSVVSTYGTLATSIFLMGWATGGLFFGMLGDRIGRSKTMLMTILLYSFFTGFSAFSRSFWDFAIYRFLTGLGVGGEFAVGVALVAEVMPANARPYALGLLQALSAVGNLTAALISIYLGHLEQQGIIGKWNFMGVNFTAWRLMFVIGTLPALLAVVIRRRLKEPDKWKEVVSAGGATKPLGSYAELFGDARWRNRAIVGTILAMSGVIGLWGIVFFSVDLTRSVLRKAYESESREKGEAEWDHDVVRMLATHPDQLKKNLDKLQPADMIGLSDAANDAAPILSALRQLATEGTPPNAPFGAEKILDTLDTIHPQLQTAEIRRRRLEYLAGSAVTPMEKLDERISQISQRARHINGNLSQWAGKTSMMLNLGAFFGIYGFSLMTSRIGRRPAFAISFIAAGLSTALVFAKMTTVTDILWMTPLMGFCTLSLFGGYAIYFPELFPTRLRSTGTSFCYNVGRFIAAIGPYFLGKLTSTVFAHHPEPMRPAGLLMCTVFILGLLTLPFAPETRNQPLPE